MVYNKRFVVIVKVNGKVLREKKDIVYIPFGSEYEITLKNLDTINAVANIEVDGSDTMCGNKVIVPPNESVTIEGFMKGNKVKNRFKFIEKTKQISDFRGDKVSDGLVRVTYQFEYKWPQTRPLHYVDPCQVPYGRPPVYGSKFEPTCTSDVTSSSLNTTFSCASNGSLSRRVSVKSSNKSNTPKSINDPGITVKGSHSDQKFTTGHVGTLDVNKHVIVIQLKGKLKKKKIYKAVTVKTKVQCETCGKKSKSHKKFCSGCGTSLV